jgi:hypothetical protein
VKRFSPFIFSLVFCALPFALHAQLQLFTNAAPQGVFFGAAKNVSITLHNSGGQNFNDEIRARIYQASSATAVLLSENPWKQVQVPAGETVLESAALDFPAVKAKTKFLVQWLGDTNVLGMTPVLVYPTNLLQSLRTFLSETNFGVFDPGNRLKSLLKAQGIKFADLAQTGLDDFSGQLAVIGPFQSRAQVPDGLAEQILALAKKNVAVVWIQPGSARTRPRFESGDMSPQSKISPSFYCVQKKQTAVVVVQPELVDGLAENPQSQLNLVYFCQLALNPSPPVLPGLPPP